MYAAIRCKVSAREEEQNEVDQREIRMARSHRSMTTERATLSKQVINNSSPHAPSFGGKTAKRSRWTSFISPTRSNQFANVHEPRHRSPKPFVSPAKHPEGRVQSEEG